LGRGFGKGGKGHAILKVRTKIKKTPQGRKMGGVGPGLGQGEEVTRARVQKKGGAVVETVI